jgi:hypothetical protein
VAKKLQQERPQHFHARALADEHSEERKKQAQNDEQNLKHAVSILLAENLFYPAVYRRNVTVLEGPAWPPASTGVNPCGSLGECLSRAR